MKNSKLIVLLKSFNDDEFKEFGYFVNSPFFTRNKKLPVFYELLAKYFPSFNSPNLTNETIHKKLYPGKDFSEKNIKYLKTELYKIAESFLIVLDCRDHEFTSMWHLLNQYSKRVLPVEFGKTASGIKSLIENSNIRNNDYYFKNYLLKKDVRNFYETKKPLGKRTVFFEGIKEELDELIIYFVVKMLKYYAILRNQENHLNYTYNYKLQNELMAYAKENLLNTHPIAAIFYFLNLLYKDTTNDSVYFELKDLVEKNHEILEDEDAELIYSELFNYSKIKYMEGKNDYGSENAAMMKLMLSKDIFPRENNYMSENSFINTVFIGVRENDFVWVEEFINKFIVKVAPERRDNAYNFCLGFVHYKKKEYNEALSLLSKIKTDDFYYYLRVKNHLIKIYFETDEIDGVLSTIDAFRHFLASNKLIPDYVKERFTKYINYLQKLIKTLESNDDYKLNKLKEEIYSSAEFENKAWLLEQIEELKN